MGCYYLKKRYKFFVSILLCFITLSVQTFTAYAVEVNMKQVSVGSTVTYEIHAVSCPKNVLGVDFSIHYDSSALQYVEGSLQIPNLSGYLTNTDLDGEIRLSVADLTGFEFQADKILAEAQFTVISDYNPYPELSFEIRDFVDVDLTNHGDAYIYELTYVDDEISSFANSSTAESKAESVSSSEAVSSDETSKSSSSVRESGAVSERLQTSDSDASSFDLSEKNSSSDLISSETVDIDTKDTADLTGDESYKEGKSKLKLLFIAIPIAVAVIAVLFIIIRCKSSGNHMS